MAQPIDPCIFETFEITEKWENLHERMRNDEEQDYEENRDCTENRVDQIAGVCAGSVPRWLRGEVKAISCVDIGKATDSMDSNGSSNAYTRFERICLDREVLRTALVATSVVCLDRCADPPKTGCSQTIDLVD